MRKEEEEREARCPPVRALPAAAAPRSGPGSVPWAEGQPEGRARGPSPPQASPGVFRKHRLHFQGNFAAAESAATASPALPVLETEIFLKTSFLYFLSRERKETKGRRGREEDAGGGYFPKLGGGKVFLGRTPGHGETGCYY